MTLSVEGPTAGGVIGAFERVGRRLLDSADLTAIVLLIIAFVPRFLMASGTYLHPDEAKFFSLSLPDRFPELYLSALQTYRPPLYIVLMHYAGKITESELSLRAISAVSGTVFPWFIYRWLGLAWNKAAGLLALLILAFAPHLISLSAQARGYMLAFLAIAVSLYCLERAIESSSSRWLAASASALYVGIFTEYLVAFYCAAAGMYFIARVWGRRQRRFIFCWMATQVGGLAIYALFLITHVSRKIGDAGTETQLNGWLHGALRWPGDNAAVFLATATVKQFAYLFASVPVGLLMIFPFLIGLWLLYRGRLSDQRRGRATLLLFLVPFLLTAVGAFAHYYPYGRSRHTAFLGIFIACSVAIALERLLAARSWILLPFLVLAIGLWLPFGEEDQYNIPSARHDRQEMLETARTLRETVLPGSTVLISQEARWLTQYYVWPDTPDFLLVNYRYTYSDLSEVAADVQRLRRDARLAADAPVWFIEGPQLVRYRGRPLGEMYRQTIRNPSSKTLYLVRIPPGWGLPQRDGSAARARVPVLTK